MTFYQFEPRPLRFSEALFRPDESCKTVNDWLAEKRKEGWEWVERQTRSDSPEMIWFKFEWVGKDSSK